MRLEIWPTTEVEYGETIGSLQSFIASSLELLQKGAIPRQLETEIEDARKIVGRLIAEIAEQFSVFVPMPSALSETDVIPEGMISFWDWEEKMRRKSFTSDFKNMICSACPYTLGLEHLIKTGGYVPCSLATCYPRTLCDSSECILVSRRKCTAEELEKNIRSKFGEAALDRFLAHQKTLA